MRYEDEDNEVCLFICVNNISFVNNILNCKSSQKYIMMLFRDAIAWKVSKQNIVIISSTEAELLALSQTVKKVIFISWLFNALMLKLNELLVIKCNNSQTLRLVRKKFMKLSIKLYHVDIHNHWLCQEYAKWRVLFNWISTKDMIMNELIKALLLQWHETFVKLIKINNIMK